MDKLTFLRTITPAQFKAEIGSDVTIAKTGNGKLCLMSVATKQSVAAVSQAITSKADFTAPVVSEVEDSEGKKFFLAHNASTTFEEIGTFGV